MMKLSLELHSLLVRFIHDVTVFLQFVNLYLVISQLFITLLFHFLDCVLELIDDFVVILLIQLFKLRYLVLECDRPLQFRVVLILESSLHLRSIHLLLGESVVQITDLLLPIVY